MIEPLLDIRTIVRIKQLVDNASNIVITCHLSPDGDAVGSTLALCRVLRNMGKSANVVTPDMVPKSLHFVPNLSAITSFTINEERAKMLVSRADLFFCLDFNTLHRIDRLGEHIEKSKAPRILIDHHLNPDPIFDVVVSHPQLSSTCEIVFRVVNELRWRRWFDRTCAQYVFLGMMTDTGNFTYSSEYPAVYQVLAQLMTYNIDKQRIYNLAMNTFTDDCLRLQGYAISEKMKVFPEHAAALISLSKAELERFNYKRGDTEGLVNKPLAIPCVQWVVFLREDPESVKVSCRSIGNISVADICSAHFGGGGHTNAACGDFYGPIEEAEAKVIEIINDFKI